jgi:hypothetical protein
MNPFKSIVEYFFPRTYLFAIHHEHINVREINSTDSGLQMTIDVELYVGDIELQEWLRYHMVGRYKVVIADTILSRGRLNKRFTRSNFFIEFLKTEIYGIQITRSNRDLGFVLIEIHKRDDAMMFRLAFDNVVLVDGP